MIVVVYAVALSWVTVAAVSFVAWRKGKGKGGF
jgi:hypothetical protein